jgi:hypothetical protein
MKHRIYLDEIPEQHTIQTYIRESTDWLEQRSKVDSRFSYDNTKIWKVTGLDLDLEKLKVSAYESFDKYGSGKGQGYIFITKENQEGIPTEGVDVYTAMSTVYNQDHIEKLDPNKSTLGSRTRSKQQYYRGGKNKESDKPNLPSVLRNSYYDSWAFTKTTPALSHGELGKLSSNTLRRSQIRGRMGMSNAKNYTYDKFKFDGNYSVNQSWHRDEPVYENLRIMIPINTSEEFRLGIKGRAEDINLDPGSAYILDTHNVHRVYPMKHGTNTRITVIYGTSPWFDYDEQNRCWTSNEFYGKLHPFEMLKEHYFNADVDVEVI